MTTLTFRDANLAKSNDKSRFTEALPFTGPSSRTCLPGHELRAKLPFPGRAADFRCCGCVDTAAVVPRARPPSELSKGGMGVDSANAAAGEQARGPSPMRVSSKSLSEVVRAGAGSLSSFNSSHGRIHEIDSG